MNFLQSNMLKTMTGSLTTSKALTFLSQEEGQFAEQAPSDCLLELLQKKKWNFAFRVFMWKKLILSQTQITQNQDCENSRLRSSFPFHAIFLYGYHGNIRAPANMVTLPSLEEASILLCLIFPTCQVCLVQEYFPSSWKDGGADMTSRT